MKKLFEWLTVLALVLAACGGMANSVAATVDDQDITVGSIQALIDPASGTIPRETFARFLSFGIRWAILQDAAAEQFGIEPTDAEISAEADRIFEISSEGQAREEFLSSRGVTEEFLLNIARQGLLDQGVRTEFADDLPDPSQEEIEAEAEVAAASFTEVCVSHILVETDAEARDVIARLNAGEEFAGIAAETSLDPGSAENGGALPCGPAAQYVSEFRDASLDAPIGELYDEVVETQFGFHVMVVTGRVDPNPEDLPTTREIIDQLKGVSVEDEVQAWFTAQMEAAEVTVDEEHGVWVSSPTFSVVAPTIDQ